MFSSVLISKIGTSDIAFECKIIRAKTEKVVITCVMKHKLIAINIIFAGNGIKSNRNKHIQLMKVIIDDDKQLTGRCVVYIPTDERNTA